jgi:hypothetical protein
VLRIHSSGDFFSEPYAAKWIDILRQSPPVKAYGYTRSWRVPTIVPVLGELARLSNVRLWFSCDVDTGLPQNVPTGVRVAWLQSDPDEPVPAGVNLVFRPRALRRRPVKRISLALVCPTEQGRGHDGTCTSCALCWR